MEQTCATGVLRRTINMILADFQTHCFYCQWKKDTFSCSGCLTVSFHQHLKLLISTSQSSLGFFLLVLMGACSGMSDNEKQPSDKRHIPPDVFQAAQGSRILVFCVVQAKSPAHKKREKINSRVQRSKLRFASGSMSLEMIILVWGFSVTTELIQNEIFCFKVFFHDFQS